jgi:nucleoside-diphosphate-sugar epimerase
LIINNKKQQSRMKVVIAGGDGFIGWPLALRLSNLGY